MKKESQEMEKKYEKCARAGFLLKIMAYLSRFYVYDSIFA